MFSKNSKDQLTSSSIIGESVLIDGNFECHEDVVVHGKINGFIKTSFDVYVKATSVINADIKAKNIFIEGTVKGNIDVKEYVEISSTAKVDGDISTKIINIEKGASFNGKCIIKEDKHAEDVKSKSDDLSEVVAESEDIKEVEVKSKSKKQK